MKYTNIKQIPTKPLIHRDFLNHYFVNGPTLHAVYYMGYSTGSRPPVFHRTSERVNMKYLYFILRATRNGRREASIGETRAFYMSLYNTVIL